MPTLEPQQITLFRHPLIALKLLFEVLRFSIKYWYLLLILILALWAVVNLEQLRTIKEMGWFALYWIVLGVASSIGLGTGLHTFVLYLGPHIAKVVVASIDCGYVPEMMPSRWNFSYFKECPGPKTSEVSVLSLVAAVQIQAFLWGLGTAIGELPPYYISRQSAIAHDQLKQYQEKRKRGQVELTEEAALELQKKVSEGDEQNQALKEVEQIQNLQNKTELTRLEKVKLFFFNHLQKHGFITILLLASIPNPLFDLAGITCGHFKIPFLTFFLSTMIGKAIVKVHIQVFFIIFMFSERHVENLLQLIQSWLPFLENKLLDMMEKQKKLLFQPETYSSQKPLLGKLWDLFLILMIGYFVLSILNSSIQQHFLHKHMHEKDTKETNKQKKKQNKKSK